MAASYKRMLQLLERWPADTNKTGRDLGHYLREQVKLAFSAGKFDTNQEECDKKYLALKRLVEDHHLKKHPRSKSSSATGLTAEQCKIVLTKEFLELLEKENQSMTQKVMSFVTRK